MKSDRKSERSRKESDGSRTSKRTATSKPSFSSSPRIFGAPQSEFSAARRRMRVAFQNHQPGAICGDGNVVLARVDSFRANLMNSSCRTS